MPQPAESAVDSAASTSVKPYVHNTRLPGQSRRGARRHPGRTGRSPLLLCLLAVTGAGTGCAGSGAAIATPEPATFDFARMADSIVNTPPLQRAHIGILVYDPATGRTLYEHNAERHFVPASNEKLWATSTALHELGPEWRYRTPVLAAGFDRVVGTAASLLVVGRGDPTMSARFHGDDFAALGMLADSVAAAEVNHITGDLVVDARYFDEAIVPGSWTFGNLNGTSAPPTGAFVVAEGIYRVAVTAGTAIGELAGVEVLGPEGVEPLVNRVATVPPGTSGGTSNRRGPWSDTLHISGVAAIGSPPRFIRLPMTDPVRFAAGAFADALRERGVTLDGEVVVVHTDEQAAVHHLPPCCGGSAANLTEVASWTSPPMSEIVTAILVPSQNWIAEQLLRTLGAERGETGSWREGLAVENRFLFDTVGIDSTALRLQDGSGMSYLNLVTPRAVVQLYDHARTAPWGPVFRAALARPNVESSTLENRLLSLDGRVEGKTGTLSNVNALSGYVRRRDGSELIFSIISNASGLGSGPVVSAIDQLVIALGNSEG